MSRVFYKIITKKLQELQNLIKSFSFRVILISSIFMKFRFQNGKFEVNETDADKDVYKLIINDFDKLHKRKYLLVRITRK